MRESLDACPEFDERILERAFQASPDADLDRHLAACTRCRSARDRYAATAAALEGALAEPEPTSVQAGRRSLGRGWVVAAAALLVVVAFWWTRRPSAIRWVEGVGAVVQRLASDRVRLERGSATFVAGSAAVVETSIGEIHTESSQFTVTMTGGDAAKLDVVRGSVHWVDARGDVLVDEGSSLTRGAVPPEESTTVLSESEPDASKVERTAVGQAAGETAQAPMLGGFEILGRVVDAETGAPVPGAGVVLCARKGRQSPQAANVRTDADGVFRGRSAPADDALLARSPFADTFAHPETFLTVEAEGYAPRSEAPPVRFVRDNPLDLKHPIDLGDLKIFRGARISGRVVLADSGRSVPEARILLALSPRSTYPESFVGDGAKEVARCGADGSFALDRRVDPCAQDRKHCLLAVSRLGVGWKELDVLATQRDVSDVEIPIGPVAALDVLVLEDSPSHTPIPGATVTAEPRFAPLQVGGGRTLGQSTLGAVPDEGLRSFFQQTTDAEGRARFELLPAGFGRYDVFARADGFVRSFEADVKTEPGRRAESRLVLHRDWQWSVEGTVKSEEGDPIAGAAVEVAAMRGATRKTTDTSGAFRFDGLDHGASGTFLSASAPGFVTLRQRVQVSRTEAAAPVRSDLVLKRARPIAGRIVDQNGAPVAGAGLTLRQGDTWLLLPNEGSKTGADGAFRFEDATAGSWDLIIEAPDPAADWVAPWSAGHAITGGDSAARIVLERDELFRSRLVVDVVDSETGAQVDPIALQVFPVGPGQRARFSMPNVDRRPGGATIERLHPGDWRIWVRAAGHGIASQDLRIEEGAAEVRATVAVGRPGILSGRVEFDGEGPTRPVCVLYLFGDGNRPGDNEWRGGSLLDAYRPVERDGTFRLEDVSPGRWQLTVRDAGWLGFASVDVPSGGEARVAVRPVRAARLVFRTAASPGDVIAYSIAEGDSSEWRLAMRMGGMKGREYVEEQTVSAGRVRWRVEFFTDSRADSSQAALTQEGELEVAAGDAIDVPVPVVSIR